MEVKGGPFSLYIWPHPALMSPSSPNRHSKRPALPLNSFDRLLITIMPTPRFTDITEYCYDEATDGYLTCTVTHPSEISIAVSSSVDVGDKALSVLTLQSQNLTIPVDDVKFSNLSVSKFGPGPKQGNAVAS